MALKTQPTGQSANQYYPSPAKAGNLHDDFRLLFDHVYDLQRRLGDAEGRVAEAHRMATEAKANAAQAVVGMRQPERGPDSEGASSTKIAGLYVVGTPPANGQKLTYNSATGQIEWQ